MLLNEKAKAVSDLAYEKLGDPYVFGAWGCECTPANRKKYAGYNPAYRNRIYDACPVLSGDLPDCEFCKWNGHLCYDCRGFTSYLLKTAAGIVLKGEGATSQYDTGQNWEIKGNVNRIPNVVCCVFKYRDGKMSHTGMHIGDGIIIHCSTVVKMGALSDTTWTHFAVPSGLYTAEELQEAGEVKMMTTVRQGNKGSNVKKLQEYLMQLGYLPRGSDDGIFGQNTYGAVIRFQTAKELTADGIVGMLTWKALEEEIAKLTPAEEPEAEEPDEEPVITVPLTREQARALYEYLGKELGKDA